MRHEGGMAMQIYSKLERALGSIHISLFPHTCLSRFLSFSLPRHSSSFSFPSSLPFRGKDARGYRNARFTAKNGWLYARKFGTPTIRSDRPLRSHCGRHMCEGQQRARYRIENWRKARRVPWNIQGIHARRSAKCIDDNHIARLYNRISK